MKISGTILCKTKDCPNDLPVRCAQKSCGQLLTNRKGRPLAVEQVEALAECPYCGWKTAVNVRGYCDPCHSKQRRKKRRLIDQKCCLECEQDHPRSKNGRCLYRNFRERGLSGLTPEQIAWFGQQVEKADGRKMMKLIVGKNWELICAIGDAPFADDPLKVRAEKIRRRSIIGKKSAAGKEKPPTEKQPAETFSPQWFWNAERRRRRLKKNLM